MYVFVNITKYILFGLLILIDSIKITLNIFLHFTDEVTQMHILKTAYDESNFTLSK